LIKREVKQYFIWLVFILVKKNIPESIISWADKDNPTEDFSISPLALIKFIEHNPFDHFTFGPPPSCLGLATIVTFSPQRLATSK
jgi:hypothetical protein